MAVDPILLPDCPELRARAEAIARARLEVLRLDNRMGHIPSWDDRSVFVQNIFITAALAELRDLSTPAGRDHACRWLWALLTGEEPRWCPVWEWFTSGEYSLSGNGMIEFEMPTSEHQHGQVHRDSYTGCTCLVVAGIADMTDTEALAAAITAALDWRRGVSNG